MKTAKANDYEEYKDEISIRHNISEYLPLTSARYRFDE